MIDPRDLYRQLVTPRMTRILTYGQAALPRDQFKAFRKLVLDEFGRNGLEGDLHAFFDEHQGKRNG